MARYRYLAAGSLALALAAPAYAAAPTWCEGYTPNPSDSSAHWVSSQLEREGYSFKTLGYMAKAACDKAGDEKRQAQVEEWRKAYLESFAETEADFARMMAFVLKPSAEQEKLSDEQCGAFELTDEMAPEDRTLARLMAGLAGCQVHRTGRNLEEPLWWLDRAELTAVQRASLVDHCIGQYQSVKPGWVNPAFAFCMKDMKSLDREAFDKEIAALKFNEYGQTLAIHNFGEIKARADRLLAQYDGLAQKDPDWKRLLETAVAGHDDWMKTYEANKAVFETIDAFAAKTKLGSKKALEGCNDELRKLFIDHLRAAKAKTLDDAKAAGADAVGYPLLLAMNECNSATGRYLEVRTALNLFSNRTERRGPRHASYHATLAVLNEIRADREKFPMERLGSLPEVGYDLNKKAEESTFNELSHDPAEGQITQVKAEGDFVKLTFKTVSWKEPVYECKTTHRIRRIASDGTLEYEQSCKRTGTETRKSTEKPVFVPKAYAAGLKAGQMARLACDTKTGKRIGIPTGVWADTGKTKFLGVFGAM